MAVINLKILVDGSAIDSEITKINASFNKGIKGTAVDNLQKKYANLISTVKNYEKSFPEGTFDRQSISLTRHLNKIKELSQAYEKKGKLTEKQQLQYRQLSKDYASISAKVATLRAETTKLEKTNTLAVPSVDNLRKGYANLINTIQGTEKNYAKGTFSKTLEEAKKGLESLKNPANQTTEGLTKLDGTLKKLQADFSVTKTSAANFHGSLLDIVTGFGKFQLAAMAIMVPLKLLRSAWESINTTLVETENRVTTLRRVAGDMANSDEIYELAQQYSVAFSEASEVVERFSKAGYDWNEALKAAEAALTAMKIAEMDAEEASEGLIAVLKQFELLPSDLQHVVAILNTTADEFAVDTEELLIALQKTSASAKAANLTLEETVGLITAMSEGTAASGQNIGNALRSLFSFTSNDRALQKFSSLSADMASLVRSYKSGGASILDVWKGLSSEMKKMGDYRGNLRELFDGTYLTQEMETHLTTIENEFDAIYGTVGTYRQNYWISLLNNIETAENAINGMQNAESRTQEELNKELETYENQLESLKTHWGEIASDMKLILDLKKQLVGEADEWLDIVDTVSGSLDNAYDIAKEKWDALFGENKEAKANVEQWGGAASTFFATSVMGVPGLGILNLLKEGITELNEQFGVDAEEPEKIVGEVVEDLKSTGKDVEGYLEKIKISLSDLGDDALKNISAELEKIKNETKETYEYEEKKKAILDAEQALIDAQNNRMVYTYNAETGTFEYMQNEKAVVNAQEKLEQARQDAKISAIEEIQNLVAQKATDKEIIASLNKWSEIYGLGSSWWVNEILNALKSEGINIDPKAVGVYDNGGVLRGLGGIKATPKDEVVLSPDIASKILSPVSNEQFHQFVSDLGLLFGASKSAFNERGNIIYRNSTSNTDSHDTYVNGVPISAPMAERSTVRELIDALNLL